MNDSKKIVIIGTKKKLRDKVEQSIRGCLAGDDKAALLQYGMDNADYLQILPEALAVFVILDSANTLGALRRVSRKDESLPVVVVSNHPQYALEGIREKVRHYLLFPLSLAEMREALSRAGIEVKPLEKNIVI